MGGSTHPTHPAPPALPALPALPSTPFGLYMVVIYVSALLLLGVREAGAVDLVVLTDMKTG